MKRAILILTGLLTVAMLHAQEQACRQDTIYFLSEGYRGTLTWQSSLNGTDWSAAPGANGDTLMVIAAESAWYRSEVMEGTCQPIYSDAIRLTVNELPVVTFEFRDSICINEAATFMTGGVPTGGTYRGNGVIDSKFIPLAAGAGRHQLSYRYRDPETFCSATVFTMVEVIPLTSDADAGEDKKAITADSVQLDAAVPEFGSGAWSVVNGEGGYFSDIHDPKAWFTRDSTHLNYTLRWTVSNKCSSKTDEVDMGFLQLSINPCPDLPVITDADGNVYPTVQIGEQCWMAKSLNTGRMVMSTVSDLHHSDMADNGVVEKYCYDNDPYNCDLYGGLYDWDEAMAYTTAIGSRGICPPGWHIPGDEDWKELNRVFKYGDAGTHLKAGGSSGFEAYFSGDRHATGVFYSFGSTGFFIESGTYTYEGANEGYVREVCACNGYLAREHFSKKTGVSIRCVKDK